MYALHHSFWSIARYAQRQIESLWLDWTSPSRKRDDLVTWSFPYLIHSKVEHIHWTNTIDDRSIHCLNLCAVWFFRLNLIYLATKISLEEFDNSMNYFHEKENIPEMASRSVFEGHNNWNAREFTTKKMKDDASILPIQRHFLHSFITLLVDEIIRSFWLLFTSSSALVALFFSRSTRFGLGLWFRLLFPLLLLISSSSSSILIGIGWSAACVCCSILQICNDWSREPERIQLGSVDEKISERMASACST